MGFRKFPYNIDYYVVGGLKRPATGEVKRKRGRPPASVSDILYASCPTLNVSCHVIAYCGQIRGTSKETSKLCEKFFVLSFSYK